MEKISIFSSGPVINVVDIQRAISEKGFVDEHKDGFLSLKDKLDDCEKQYIRHALNLNEGKIGKTADFLKIDRTTLFKKMHKYGIIR